MNRAVYDINDEAAMGRFGKVLADALPTKIVIALIGTLGAGKTRLVRAMAEAWKVPTTEIGSPTFVLCREYQGTRTAYHLDVYRMTDESELLDLGFEELLEADATVLVEWADRVRGCLPPSYLEIEIIALDIDRREVTVIEVGEPSGVIERLAFGRN